MSFDPRTTGNFTDFAALTRLKAAARMDKRASTSTVARQFETLFTQMMLKSMRSASLGSGILDSEQSKQYRDLADSQLAMSLSTRGNGLGIAKMLERQLLGDDVKDAASTPHALNPLPQRPAAMQKLDGADASSATTQPSISDDAKTLRNGPCGGVRPDGHCEVKPEMRCVWVKAVERAPRTPWAHEIDDLRPPVDNRLWGTSSWRNFLSKRDKETPKGWHVAP